MQFAWIGAAVVLAAPGAASAAAVAASPGEASAAVHAAFATALVAGDAAAIARLYAPDAISTPEFQPSLTGPGQIAEYWKTIAGRLDILDYAPVREELIDLGDGHFVETGRFSLRWRVAEGAVREEAGKFVAVYRADRQGMRLVSDVRGFARAIDEGALFHVALAPVQVAAPADAALERELAVLNQRNADAVRAHQLAPQLTMYAPDAVFWPFAGTAKRGIAAIRAHLTPYVAQGAGVAFDEVRVWHDRATRHGRWVLENSRFLVRWRSGEASGATSGGGLRLWRREADGQLRMFRQIGTHDYRG